MPAQDRLLAPPIVAVFSIMITFAPLSAAETAADTPDAPAPTTTTSADSCSVLPSPALATSRALNASTLLPAWLRASSTAARMALLDSEAPLTASTARVWPAIISSLILLMASTPMPAVSVWLTTLISVIVCAASSVTSTWILPSLPSASAL
ncbi:hypothetical protein D3C74_383400 [compost metagenome]